MNVDSRIVDRIGDLIAESLCIERELVTPQSWFAADLDGESLDLLDLSFRIEREFGVRLAFNDLIPGKSAMTAEGKLTDDALRKMKERFSSLNIETWRDRRFDRPLELLQVADIAAMVQSDRAARAQVP